MAVEPITAVLNIGSQLIDRLWPDPVQAANAKLKLFEMEKQGELAGLVGQLEINKVEAANPSLFVSGWRPFVGWVCGVGLAMQFLLSPLLTWGAAIIGIPLILPSLDLGVLVTMLGGMLGLGGLRTLEKVKEVARK